MFEFLAGEHKIAVTGPQRSGTRIAAKMIAADTGLTFIDEEEFQFAREDEWRETLLGRDEFVIQCPSMLKPLVDMASPEVFVVLMRRPLEEIHASQHRIDWKQYESWELARFGVQSGDSAALKYEYWDSNEKPPRHLEVAYSSLEQHPDFVAAPARAGFGPHQTSA